VIVAHVNEAPKLTDFPPVAGIELGDDPAIIFARGDRAGIGDPIQDGWVVHNIERNAITLKRDAETTVITL